MRKFLYVILLSIITGCSGQVLDLSTITIGESVNNYNLDKLKPSKKYEQKGHYEVKRNGEDISLDLVNNGEKVINYSFDGENIKKLNYMGYSIEKVMGAKIVVYNGHIEFVKVDIFSNERQNLGFYKDLIHSLGIPTDIIYGLRKKETVVLGADKIMKKEMPLYVQTIKDDYGDIMIKYPQYMFWNKGNIIYRLTIEPVNNNVSSSLEVFSKKVLKDNIIFGMQNAEKDSIFSKYLK